MKQIRGEARLTFMEATSIIVGHGVGSGVLAVPYLASRNSWWHFLLIVVIAYGINLLMHFMIAELSYNNDGAQFIKCFERELFVGKLKTIATWVAFGLLGFSVIINVSGFITGAAAVLSSWFGWPTWVGMLVYYVLAALVVNFGMKLVGICEKISVYAMVVVIVILFAATMLAEKSALPTGFVAFANVLALYSMVSFSLSAVMSVPQVVKGLEGDAGKIRGAIVAGTAINVGIILVITLMTLIGAGTNVSQDGALVDLAAHLGGWVGIVGYVFSLLAISTSFWANTLNLRDIVKEQTPFSIRISYLLATVPCLVIAFFGGNTFVGFTRLAGVIQILTGIGIIIAYHRSRKREGTSVICGRLGILPFQILVVASSVLATVGSVLSLS